MDMAFADTKSVGMGTDYPPIHPCSALPNAPMLAPGTPAPATAMPALDARAPAPEKTMPAPDAAASGPGTKALGGPVHAATVTPTRDEPAPVATTHAHNLAP